jgi:hypothetical protein
MASKVSALTAAQLTYARERAAGKTGLEAYRLAYPNAKASDATARKEAKRLDKRAAIAQSIADLQVKTTEAIAKATAEQFAITKQWVIEQLVENVQIAKAAVPVLDKKGEETGEFIANLAAANRALELLGKELQMFREQPSKAPDPLDGLSHDQVRQFLELLNEYARRQQPDGAAVAAEPGATSGIRH